MEEVSINEKREDGSSSMPKEWRYAPSHPKDLILGDPEQGVKTRSSLNLYVSQVEPKSFKDAECDEVLDFSYARRIKSI